jgi:predicted amidohydrolase
MIFGGFLDTDLTNQCYIIDHNKQSIQKLRKSHIRAIRQNGKNFNSEARINPES